MGAALRRIVAGFTSGGADPGLLVAEGAEVVTGNGQIEEIAGDFDVADVALYEQGRAGAAIVRDPDGPQVGVYLEVEAVEEGGRGERVKHRLMLAMDDVFRLVAELEYAGKVALLMGG